MARERVRIAVISGAHGVEGAVRVKSFTAEPEAVAAYGPLSDESGGRRFALEVIGRLKGAVIARIEGVGDRDAAETLKGVALFVDRDALPEPEEDEFYQADLVGLVAELADGRPLGTVSAVHNFGAGDVLEIEPADGPSVMVPFTRAAVPVVDLGGGRIVIDPEAGLAPGPEPEPGAAPGPAPEKEAPGGDKPAPRRRTGRRSHGG